LLTTQGKEGIRIGQSVSRVRVARTWGGKKKRDANVSEFKEGKELSTFCDAPRGMESASAAVVPNSSSVRQAYELSGAMCVIRKVRQDTSPDGGRGR